MRKKVWHFSKRTTVWLYRFVEAIVALFIVIFSIAFWKLYTEPMDAKFMLPTLSEQLLPKESQYTLQVGSAVLSADFKEGGLFHLEMKDLQLVRPDKTVAINLPSVSLSYGVWHILTLNYMPNKLVVSEPDIAMVINKNGVWHFQNVTQKQPTDPKPHKEIDVRRILKHSLSFDDIEITNGVMIIEDLEKGKTLSLPNFALRLHKSFGGLRHIAHLSAVARVDDHLTDIKAKATYGRITKNLEIDIGITPVYVSRYGRFIPILGGIDVPVTISVSTLFNTKKVHKNFLENLESAKFQVKAVQSGVVRLPSPIENTYHLETAEINGAVSQGMKTIKIAESEITLNHGIQADLEVAVKGMDKFIAHKNVNDLHTTLNAWVKNVPMSEVTKVWPAEQGTSAHTWVKNHLRDGLVPLASFRLDFDGGDLSDVYGEVDTQGVTVDYLPDMPAIKDVAAKVILTPTKVSILADKGQAGNVKLINADLLFAPLDAEITDLSMVLDLTGPINEMLLAINQKPLELLDGLDFDWKQIKGNAEAEVQLSFPLDEETLTQQLQVLVTAKTTNGGLVMNHFPLKINSANAEAIIDNKGIKLQGTAQFKNQTLNVVWQERFNPSNEPSGEYDISGKVQAETLSQIIPDVEQYVSGEMPLHINLKRFSPKHQWQAKAKVDLKNTKTVIHALSVVKEKQNPLSLEIDLTNANLDFSSGSARFVLSGQAQEEPLQVKGSAQWGQEWQVVLDTVKTKGNDFSGQIGTLNQTLTMIAKGQRVNLSQIKQMPFLKQDLPEDAPPLKMPPNILFDIKLNEVILNQKMPIQKVIVVGKRENKLWKYFQSEATAEEPFVVVYNPDNKQFQGTFENLGTLLLYADISDRFSSGKLKMISTQQESGLIKGKVLIKDAELNETSFLLQAASILGIVDAFRGKNIVFNEIHIPFQISPEGEITLTDAYAASANIGITVKGTINLDRLNLEGGVIPAYAVNSLPGKIPLIGGLFREGAGGGLISLKYALKGRLANPEVEFFPLSSMAPGALGYIF